MSLFKLKRTKNKDSKLEKTDWSLADLMQNKCLHLAVASATFWATEGDFNNFNEMNDRIAYTYKTWNEVELRKS